MSSALEYRNMQSGRHCSGEFIRAVFFFLHKQEGLLMGSERGFYRVRFSFAAGFHCRIYILRTFCYHRCLRRCVCVGPSILLYHEFCRCCSEQHACEKTGTTQQGRRTFNKKLCLWHGVLQNNMHMEKLFTTVFRCLVCRKQFRNFR